MQCMHWLERLATLNIRQQCRILPYLIHFDCSDHIHLFLHLRLKYQSVTLNGTIVAVNKIIMGGNFAAQIQKINIPDPSLKHIIKAMTWKDQCPVSATNISLCASQARQNSDHTWLLLRPSSSTFAASITAAISSSTCMIVSEGIIKAMTLKEFQHNK